MKKCRHIWLIICLTLLLSACTAVQQENSTEEPSQGPTWQELYDLGVRYLSEGNYEEAILVFTTAIEIDPKQAEIYLGLSDVYVSMGNIEWAAQVLYDAIQIQGNERLLTDALEHLGFMIDVNGTLRELAIDNILQGAKKAVDDLYHPDGYESYLTYDELHNMFDPIKEKLKLYIIRKPDDSQGYFYLGGIYCILNEMDLCLAVRQEGFLKTGDTSLTPSNHAQEYYDGTVECDAWGRIIRWVDDLGVPRTYQYGDGAQLAHRIVEQVSERVTSDYSYENGRCVSLNWNVIGQVGEMVYEYNRIYTYEYPDINVCIRRYWMVEEEESGSDYDVITFDSYGNITLRESYNSLNGELRYSVEL